MATPESQSRSIPVSKDLMYKAKLKFPGYDAQQALTLYMIDEFSNQRNTDDTQTKLINAQRSENEKLKGALSNLGRELDQLEKESVSNDNEIARLKDLTAKLRPASELTQQAAQVSAKEAARIEQELEKLKNKPGMDEKKYNELNSRVQELIKMPGISSKEVKELEQLITNLEKQNVITASMFVDTRQKLDAKEERFQKYIEKKRSEIAGTAGQHASEMKKYADIVNSYKDEITNFKNFMNQEKDSILSLKGDIENVVSNLQSKADEYLDFMDIRGKEANQAAQQAIGNAQTKSQQTIQRAQPVDNKPQSSGPSALTSLSSDIEKELEKERHMANVSKNIKNPIVPVELKEDVRPARTTGNPEYDEWLKNNLPILLKLFKNKFKEQLELKDPTYGDNQIAYEIEELASWLYNVPEEVLTKQHLIKFMNAVKVALFRQPVEPEQFDLDLRESLDKTYERMLDKLIGLKYL